jgi:dihydropteroate synthase
MGIVNVTPDSFWDGGRHHLLDAALSHAEALLEEGADILDVGGESTRPGALPVSIKEELERVLPVIRGLAARWPDALISIDTVKADVARAAFSEGAAIANDVSGLRLDRGYGSVVSGARGGLLLMHSRGTVAEMARYESAVYGSDPVGEICHELQAMTRTAKAAGVAEESIVIDPGLGFSKRTEHSLAVLTQLRRVLELGYPVLVGPSRKRFVGELAGGLPAEERLEGTIAACVVALLNGARLFRVHDVKPVRHALAVAEAVRIAGA